MKQLKIQPLVNKISDETDAKCVKMVIFQAFHFFSKSPIEIP